MTKRRTPTDDYERRKQSKLHKLGTNNPRCPCCSETHWRVFEQHHLAGRKHDDLIINICANDHRRLTDSQSDHLKTEPSAEELLAQIGNFLLGLADMLVLIIERLYEFGNVLIAHANEGALKPEGRA
jgi:hypothetical protein